MCKFMEITPKVQESAVKFLGKEITQSQLNLSVSIFQAIAEERSLETLMLSKTESDALKLWRLNQHLHLSTTNLVSVTKEFFAFISELYFLAYYDSQKPSHEEKRVKPELGQAFYAFFDWDTEDKTIVTSNSAMYFAVHWHNLKQKWQYQAKENKA